MVHFRNCACAPVVDQYAITEYLQGGYTTTADKSVISNAIDPGEVTAGVIIVGQSNAANFLPRYTAASPKVQNVNIYDGLIYNGADPVLGASGTAGCFAFPLGDELITAGTVDRVILSSIAVGGTTVAQWGHAGVFNHRIMVAIKRFRQAGIPLSAMVWCQGESDHGTAQADYEAKLREVIETSRGLQFTGPWFIPQCTYVEGVTDAAVRAAQAAVVDPAQNIYSGGDFDALTGATYRQADNVHFNEAGADEIAVLLTNAFASYF